MAEQVQKIKGGNEKEDKDDKYKTDKTGQYVSKDVQVTGYEDGRERPTRPKLDAADAISPMSEPLEPPCDPNISDCGTTVKPVIFRTSVGLGAFSGNPSGAIYALRIIIGDNSSILPSEGHIKINADLNKGAGGKYIYLTFTRNPLYTRENYVSPVTHNTPITNLRGVSYSQVCWTVDSPYFCDINPDLGWMYAFRYSDSDGESYKADLNDGAGGKYIFAHVTRDTYYGTPIKEVGVISGGSSTIKPPSGWVKVNQDLNEGSGGDHIYFCYKK